MELTIENLNIIKTLIHEAFYVVNDNEMILPEWWDEGEVVGIKNFSEANALIEMGIKNSATLKSLFYGKNDSGLIFKSGIRNPKLKKAIYAELEENCTEKYIRYCHSCKKEVGKKLTNGQIWAMIFLHILFLIPGSYYIVHHKIKCPICCVETYKKIVKKKDIKY